MTDIADTSLPSVFKSDPEIRSCDFRTQAAGRRLYVIFLTPRSGSTWLTYQARRSGHLGTPQEWFNEDYIRGDESVFDCAPPRVMGLDDINKYVRHLVSTTTSPDGNAGVQLSRYQAEWVCNSCDNPDRMLRYFTPFYLRRRNIVAQAISLYRSSNSGYYHSYQPLQGRQAFLEVGYDETQIRNTIWFLLQNEVWFEWMMRRYRLKPYRFVYEDMLESMSATLSWLYETLTARPMAIKATEDRTVSKLADDVSLEWEIKFRASHEDFLLEREATRSPFKTDLALRDLINKTLTVR